MLDGLTWNLLHAPTAAGKQVIFPSCFFTTARARKQSEDIHNIQIDIFFYMLLTLRSLFGK